MQTANFSNLIAPITTEDFFKTYWEKEFLHIDRNEENYFDNILSINDIDDFLSFQNLIPEGIRVINNGKFLDQKEWTSSETLLDGTIKTVANPEKLFNHFQSGATIIINSAEKTISKLAKACITFEHDLNIKVQSNIYITPPNSKGFKLHYDLHDICLMQIQGPKTWNIYDSGEQLPSTYSPFTNEPKLVKTVTINSGDFVYMPRGTVHEAFSSDATTIHFNFSFKPRYGYHLLEELAKVAEKNEVFFRRTIPNKLSSDQEKESYIKLFSEKLQELIRKTLPEELLQKQKEDFNKKKTIDFHGRFKNILKSENLTVDSSVIRKRGFSYTVREDNHEMTIFFGNKKVIIPSFIEKEIFLSDESFQIKQIKGLISNQGKLDLVKQFIGVGFLQIVEN